MPFVQRLYPVLLSISIALAVAIFLRPRLAEDLTGLAVSTWNSLGSAAQAAIGSTESRLSGTGGQVNPSSYPYPSTSAWPATPLPIPQQAAPAANAVAEKAGETAISDIPVYPSTDSATIQPQPSAPSWQQDAAPVRPLPSAPPQQQTAVPAWPQPSAPAWQQEAAPPNGVHSNSALGGPPGGSGWNVPANGAPQPNWSNRPVNPGSAAPVWNIPEVPRQAAQPASQAQGLVSPQGREPDFVARSLPPVESGLGQREEDRLREASGNEGRAPSGWPVAPDATPQAAAPPEQTLQGPQTPAAGQMPPEAQLFERGQIVGRVGTEVILYGEIGLGVPEVRAHYKDRMPADELEAQVEKLLKSRLKPHIETKLVYLDAKRTIPPDALKNFEKRVGEEFERTQVAQIMKSMKADSRYELEQKLRALNSSLEQQKRAFVEQMIAHQWIKQQVKVDEEVTYQQMLTYYREHLSDYEHPARARWQQLMVRFSRIPDKAEAYRTMAEMGNQVLGGNELAEVARAGSDGPTARSGGLRDWTTEGSLVSQALDRAIFSLPVGQLSPILEDEQGFHIVCVLERNDANRTSFDEAQAGIRKKIRQEREQDQEQTYLAKLWEKTPVWTAFDASPGDVRVSGRPAPTASPTSRAGWSR